MKKLISLLSSIAITASASLMLSASAQTEEKYAPLYYFKAEQTEGVKILSDDTICISPEALSAGDLTLDLSVYIEDELQNANSSQGVYAASAKWRSESDYITLGGLVDPSASTSEVKEYTTSEGDVFVTDKTPFCYASIQDDGSLKFSSVPQLVELPEINSLYFTYAKNSNIAVFDALGATSDEYAFAHFNAVVDSETPEGVYEIVFATSENTEGDNSVVSHGAVMLSFTNFYSFKPETRDLTIIVGDVSLGDVDNDGNVNALDASLILTAYANTATSQPSGLTALQSYAADVDANGAIDAIDASEVLGYYAYTATGGSGTLEEYLAM